MNKTEVAKEGFRAGLVHKAIAEKIMEVFPAATYDNASALVSMTKLNLQKNDILVVYGKKNTIPESLERTRHPVESTEVRTQPLASSSGVVIQDNDLFD